MRLLPVLAAASQVPPAAWAGLAYAGANLATLALFAWDKRRARRGAGPAGRVRESTLHLWTLASGGLGAFAGLAWLRHKSRHAAFWLSAFAGFSAHVGAWAWWIAGPTAAR